MTALLYLILGLACFATLCGLTLVVGQTERHE